MSDEEDFGFAEEDYGFEYDDAFGATSDPYGDDGYGEEDFGQTAEDIYGEDIAEEFVEEQQYEVEMGAYGEGGRVAFKPTAGDMQIVLNEGGLQSLSQAVGREYKDPLERFRGVVDAICRNLEIDDAIIVTLVDRSIHLKNIEYLNPVGYIFGYIATNGGRQMDNTEIQNIFKQIPTPRIQNLNVGMTPPDVIRYARFWMNFRRKFSS